MTQSLQLAIVMPTLNERKNLRPLVDRLEKALAGLARVYVAGGLLDRAQGRAQDKAPDSVPGKTEEKAVDRSPERKADQRVQQALRRALGELMQQFGDLTGEVPQSLSEADTAMREAGQSLGEGTDPAAAAAEQRAIEALQKGGREMGQTMAKKFGPGQVGVGEAPGDGDDPNGDQMGNSPGSRDRGNPRSRAGMPPGRGAVARPGGCDRRPRNYRHPPRRVRRKLANG